MGKRYITRRMSIYIALFPIFPAGCRRAMKDPASLVEMGDLSVSNQLLSGFHDIEMERWRWTGEGPQFVKLGGRVLYRLEDVEAYEREQIRQSTADTRHRGAA